MQVSASDVDTGAGGEVRYSCGSGCELFEVRGEDGVVLLTGPLDTETQPQHVMTVVATDAGLPQLSSSTTVVVDGEVIASVLSCRSRVI